jgi:hypothetical protein
VSVVSESLSFLAPAHCSSPPIAQNSTRAEAFLQQALRLGDVYNWSDSAQPFAEAEQLFTQAGDRRNALYARLGRLRAIMEQHSLPVLSEQLATLLGREFLLQTDQRLRLFAFLVKGDVDGELDPKPARQDWESALALAQDLGNTKWINRATGEIGFQDFLEGDFDRAQKRVFGGLGRAKTSQDAGAQIRYLSAIGTGLVLRKSTGLRWSISSKPSRSRRRRPRPGISSF